MTRGDIPAYAPPAAGRPAGPRAAAAGSRAAPRAWPWQRRPPAPAPRARRAPPDRPPRPAPCRGNVRTALLQTGLVRTLCNGRVVCVGTEQLPTCAPCEPRTTRHGAQRRLLLLHALQAAAPGKCAAGRTCEERVWGAQDWGGARTSARTTSSRPAASWLTPTHSSSTSSRSAMRRRAGAPRSSSAGPCQGALKPQSLGHARVHPDRP